MINVGDKYILHSSDGKDYNIEIVNVNHFREPGMEYACDVFDSNGNSINDDVIFTGDDFFNKECVEKI